MVATDRDALPSLRVKIDYAALNFRDFITASGMFGSVPPGYVPGNEGAGIVLASDDPAFQTGDRVFVSGHGLGEKLGGTTAGELDVPIAAACPLPDGMTTWQAATLGVAALVAVAAGQAMTSGRNTLQGGSSVAVTGAMGGTGRVAAAYFARSGQLVTAFTRDPALANVLSDLGCAEVLGLPDASALAADAFGPERFAAALDVTGTLVNWMIRHMQTDGTLALVGFSAGRTVQLNAIAVILRRLRLIGVNAGLGAAEKTRALDAVSKVLQPGDYDRLARLVQPQDVGRVLRQFGQGAGQGRIVVALT